MRRKLELHRVSGGLCAAGLEPLAGTAHQSNHVVSLFESEHHFTPPPPSPPATHVISTHLCVSRVRAQGESCAGRRVFVQLWSGSPSPPLTEASARALCVFAQETSFSSSSRLALRLALFLWALTDGKLLEGRGAFPSARVASARSRRKRGCAPQSLLCSAPPGSRRAGGRCDRVGALQWCMRGTERHGFTCHHKSRRIPVRADTREGLKAVTPNPTDFHIGTLSLLQPTNLYLFGMNTLFLFLLVHS